MIRPLAALLAYLFVAACAAPPSMSEQYVAMPAQDERAAADGKSRVYVMRKNQAYGRALLIRVYDGETVIGRVARGSFLCWERDPEIGALRVVFEQRPVDGGEISGYLELNTEPDRVYFCEIELDSRRNGKPTVTFIAESAALPQLESLAPSGIVAQ